MQLVLISWLMFCLAYVFASYEKEASKKSEYLKNKSKEGQLLLVVTPAEDDCRHTALYINDM